MSEAAESDSGLGDPILGTLTGKPPVAPSGDSLDPQDIISASASRRAARGGWWFQIPDEDLGLDWDRDRPDSDRWFMITEVKPREQSQAVKLGKDNAEAVGQEMVMQALWKIGGSPVPDKNGKDTQVMRGGWSTRGNRESVTLWWNQIGPKGRGLVQDAWIHTHQPSESSRASFLATARRA